MWENGFEAREVSSYSHEMAAKEQASEHSARVQMAWTILGAPSVQTPGDYYLLAEILGWDQEEARALASEARELIAASRGPAPLPALTLAPGQGPAPEPAAPEPWPYEKARKEILAHWPPGERFSLNDVQAVFPETDPPLWRHLNRMRRQRIIEPVGTVRSASPSRRGSAILVYQAAEQRPGSPLLPEATVQAYAVRSPAVQAVQLQQGNRQAVASWCGGTAAGPGLLLPDGSTAQPGQWVIRVPSSPEETWRVLPGPAFQQEYRRLPRGHRLARGLPGQQLG
jgi:hypothetical protein